MYSPRIKTLENCANATGEAFGCREEDFESRFIPPARRVRKIATFGILAGVIAYLVGHQFGLAKVIAVLPGLRAAA